VKKAQARGLPDEKPQARSSLFSSTKDISSFRISLIELRHAVDGRVGRWAVQRNVMEAIQPAPKPLRSQLVALEMISDQRRRVITAINPSKRTGTAARRSKGSPGHSTERLKITTSPAYIGWTSGNLKLQLRLATDSG
jgi:hypothetical protein